MTSDWVLLLMTLSPQRSDWLRGSESPRAYEAHLRRPRKLALRSFRDWCQERCDARCAPFLTSLRDSLRLLVTALQSPLVLR
jgi:hypothetical protein